jgi:hypothetical protein
MVPGVTCFRDLAEGLRIQLGKNQQGAEVRQILGPINTSVAHLSLIDWRRNAMLVSPHASASGIGIN